MTDVFIVKNTTGSAIELEDFNVLIPAGQETELGNFDRAILSEKLITKLTAGDLVRIIDGKQVGVVEILMQCACHIQPRVAINILNTPPGSPSDGDIYLVDGVPTGVWVGHAEEIAIADSGEGSGWRFRTPCPGERYFLSTPDAFYYLNSSNIWTIEGGDSVPTVIQGASEGEATTTQSSPWATLKTINLTVAQKKYKVEWYFEYGNTAKDKCVFSRIQIADTITIQQTEHESKPDGWYMPCGGVYFWDNTGGSAGSKAFDLDMYVQGNTGKARKYRIILTEVQE